MEPLIETYKRELNNYFSSEENRPKFCSSIEVSVKDNEDGNNALSMLITYNVPAQSELLVQESFLDKDNIDAVNLANNLLDMHKSSLLNEKNPITLKELMFADTGLVS